MSLLESNQVSNAPRRLVVTGGAGFIGANFVHYWCQQYPNDRVVVLDALTYAGNRQNLALVDQHPNFRFVKGDICDRPIVDALLQEEGIDTLVHFAAESHVDRSILGPDAFVRTNVVGTFTLLEAFRQHWLSANKPNSYRFHHVSTDEVYGSLNPEDPAFSETTPYAPNSPYSASKAGSDHLVRAYYHTYGMPTTMTNCSNNYGPYHFPEKLIPLICINILLGKPLPVYGDGQNVRDWLYVKDHCSAVDTVLHMVCELMDELAPNLPVRPAKELITFVKDRPGHDRRYAINSTKLQTELGWVPSVTVQEGLRQTVAWFLANQEWWQPLLSQEYQAYYQKVYA
jgi:dTDP-glucose 4,6-dehydratase